MNIAGRKRKHNTELPTRVYKHGNRYRYQPPNGKAISFCSLEAAAAYAEKVGTCTTERTQSAHIKKLSGAKAFAEIALPDWVAASDLMRVYVHAKNGAISRKIPFMLTPNDIARLAWESQGRCTVSAIPFEPKRPTTWRTNPWSISLDRKDSNAAYTPNNCRLVCVAVNMAMNEWGESVLVEVATAVCRAKGIFPTETPAPENHPQTIEPTVENQHSVLPRSAVAEI